MNLKTKTPTIDPCLVCGYPFSDRHHIWPQAKGGEKLPVVVLCPNHHRYANLVQALALQSVSDQEITAFAKQHFDSAFNHVLLDYLLEEQHALARKGWMEYYKKRVDAAIVRRGGRGDGTEIQRWSVDYIRVALGELHSESVPPHPEAATGDTEQLWELRERRMQGLLDPESYPSRVRARQLLKIADACIAQDEAFAAWLKERTVRGKR